MHAPARNSDPMTSHLAADELVASGARNAQQQIAVIAVEQYPGLTSLELANVTTLCRFLLARRLPECAEALTPRVRRGQVRRCTISKRLAVTWWPVGHEEQTHLFPTLKD